MDWFEILRRVVPQRVRRAIQESVSLRNVKLKYFRHSNPLSGVVQGDDNPMGVSAPFGIVRNSAQYHTHYVKACLELGVPFRVIDLYCQDWQQEVEESGCDVLLVWPDAVLSIWNQMIKDRIWVLESDLGFPVVPSSSELWMYEDKRRTAYWLAAKGVPHPRTWVIYDRQEAEAFIETCPLPLVFKTSFGAAATGVRIVRSRRPLRALVKKTFRRGVAPGGIDWRDRQWAHVILQEYIPDVKEWRVVRIGDAFLCRIKERRGEFHSGSGVVGWASPPKAILDFARDVTELGGYRSMAVDIFQTPDGRLLANELQCVIGPIRESNLERGAEDRGRWLYSRADGAWRFEGGDFYRNACANERVLDALARGLHRGPVTPARFRCGEAARPEVGDPSSQ